MGFQTFGPGGNANREEFDAVCSKCKKATKVPFKPKEGRPVYCKDCYREVKQTSGY